MGTARFLATALCAWFAWLSTSASGDSRLINGTPITDGSFKEVVKITSNGAPCTATVVGPNVIVTAAHCTSTGALATFSIGGTNYQATMTRSPGYPSKDHDIAVGITTSTIAGVEAASIAGQATTGVGLTLVGYGCAVDGGGVADGILRRGLTAITTVSALHFISSQAGGAVICQGDGGSPAFVITGNKHQVLGVAAKSDLHSKNDHTRTDPPDSQTFLKNFAQQNHVDICGINSDCTGPGPTKPTCTLSANPQQVKPGTSLTLSLVTTGQVTAASIDGESVTIPTGNKVITPMTEGTFTSHGSVTGPGGSNSCDATYVVKKDPPDPTKPTCTLAALPSTIKIGEVVTLQLTTTGQVTSASIDGTAVAFPLGKKMVTGTVKGTFPVSGLVTGPAGSNSCNTTYWVDDGVIPPELPNFTVVPTYCGENTLPETKVFRVCLAVLKKDSGQRIALLDALQVTYSDTTQEVMPIVYRHLQPKDATDIQVKEDLTLYANGAVKGGTFLVLDTRQATVTKLPPSRDGEVPTAIEGRTAKGSYFLVDTLSPAK